MSSSPGEIITTSQMATVMRRVTGSMGRASIKGLRAAAYIGKARAVKSIKEVPEFNSEVKFAPIDFGASGGMLGSYVVDIVPDGAVLENQAPHAAIQEFGTRPFTPNRADLEAWAARKVRRAASRKRVSGKPGKPGKAGKSGEGKPKVSAPSMDKGDRDIFSAVKSAHAREARKAATEAQRDKEAKALARRAFNSIRLHGIRPRGFHTHASQFFGGYVTEALSRSISKVTK